MSSNSQNLDEFYIPTVPRYKQLGTDELNDTLGDGLFESLFFLIFNIEFLGWRINLGEFSVFP